MNQTKRTLSRVAGISAIILGIILSILAGFFFYILVSCAENLGSQNGNENSVSAGQKLLFAFLSLLPLIISVNGILIVKEKPTNKTYRLVIHLTLIVMCLGLVVLSFLNKDEIFLVFLTAIIPAIPAIISICIKEKKELEEKEGE